MQMYGPLFGKGIEAYSRQMGYGARALQALNEYYSGTYINLDETLREEETYPDPTSFDGVRLATPNEVNLH
jgi:hypothetical protein